MNPVRIVTEALRYFALGLLWLIAAAFMGVLILLLWWAPSLLPLIGSLFD